MIGVVGTILGEAGVNITDMDVGRTAAGEAALMALSTAGPSRPRSSSALLALAGDHRRARPGARLRRRRRVAGGDLDPAGGRSGPTRGGAGPVSAWRAGTRRTRPPRRSRSSGRGGCGRSWRRPAGGRCRLATLALTGCESGQESWTGSIQGSSIDTSPSASGPPPTSTSSGMWTWCGASEGRGGSGNGWASQPRPGAGRHPGGCAPAARRDRRTRPAGRFSRFVGRPCGSDRARPILALAATGGEPPGSRPSPDGAARAPGGHGVAGTRRRLTTRPAVGEFPDL